MIFYFFPGKTNDQKKQSSLFQRTTANVPKTNDQKNVFWSFVSPQRLCTGLLQHGAQSFRSSFYTLIIHLELTQQKYLLDKTTSKNLATISSIVIVHSKHKFELWIFSFFFFILQFLHWAAATRRAILPSCHREKVLRWAVMGAWSTWVEFRKTCARAVASSKMKYKVTILQSNLAAP